MTRPPRDPPTPEELALAYHDRTKHQPHRYARALGWLDWDNQPDPFRTFEGAPHLTLDLVEPEGDAVGPAWSDLLAAPLPPMPVNRHTVSRLFYDSFALSAWKEAGEARWSLRVDPSSGNLHSTESYLVGGPIPGLLEDPGVAHYHPFHHALESRFEIPRSAWSDAMATLPEGTLLVGLTSIAWREAWKYGERAFRYCQHDLGHCLGALAFAAAAMGWRTRVLDAVTDEEAAALLATDRQDGPEAERPEAIVAVWPGPAPADAEWRPSLELLDAARAARPRGTPSDLSVEHHDWPIVSLVADATRRTESVSPPWRAVAGHPARTEGSPPARRLIRTRRSAVAMDGTTSITRDAFFTTLQRCLPRARGLPFDTLSHKPSIHLLLFVHRVDGLAPGLYLLLRHRAAHTPFWAACTRRDEFAWTRPPECPDDLPLLLLREGDLRPTARAVSCGQDIAADGAFAACMLGELSTGIQREGAAMYRRLHWEAGALGQLLYLEAEAIGVRATGIGCFYDDSTHHLLGLRDARYHAIYHFTVGGAVDDARLRTLAPYAHLDRG